ncbi:MULTISPECIES: pyridine nucleotide-disulfide oxidoreductase [Methylomonas]|uniref:Pyridine nucleotide-disulfide oxidoreductase n=2 Tax=Methylomonas TaxID=416 RepID=A0A126T284_9GAMM|nr:MULTISPECIES: pyridine nucleotide-disulfide oxidoreductase [Methylomonas]AMK76191.1 pyridine nucleotide-disulfide oxidoreductase [Methylomonas denitrificans]OAH96028.1 pyridine nucleotide-disulfide oxidoreductase [Methylomonas methanica]TCV81311.1 NADPH-dependent glutamate synthase beta subunit-like oxidoreductase [Methylomonas methanica]
MTQQLNTRELTQLTLGIPGFAYKDLYDAKRLADLLAVFDQSVQQHDAALFAEISAYRACGGEGMKPEEVSELLVKMAPLVGTFVAKLFNVEDVRDQQIGKIRSEFDSVFVYRTQIVGNLNKLFKGQTIEGWDIAALRAQLADLLAGVGKQDLFKTDPELAVSELGADLWRASQQENASATDLAAYDTVCRWSFAAKQVPELQAVVAKWLSFKIAEKTNLENLVEHETVSQNGYDVWACDDHHHRRRDGFALTDKRFSRRQALYEVDHCIYCHDRDNDSCSKGIKNKKDGTFKTNHLGAPMIGCPLEEKISEMHVVKRQGDNIGALAMIIIDNPMCPGTGHRICNDCMRGCIYQKTEAVNIPQIETNVLTDVLFMPWGFEIYSLLTRWNPLNIKRSTALPYNGKNVLVAGMGPAGYTLSHYLLNEGFGVVGIDALKIEPLPLHLTGDRDNVPMPIMDFQSLYEDLDKRVLLGFGGVAEYGITVRWDKNFLKVIYLTLLRRNAFKCYGGVRFGGTITIDEAWEMGFDHIAIASGAGKPTVIDLKNNLIRGIRKASDFLMGLQLTGAAKESSLANLQVRLPAGVIGGGLTAIDTTTELLAYYPGQVSKILHRYEKLVAKYGEAAVRGRYDGEELEILEEFLAHGRVIEQERERAAAAGETPNFLPFLKQWGGVTLFYRKGIKDSPAYRQNHEEIHEALSEGIYLAEGMSPLEAIEDQYGHLQAVRFEKLSEEDGKWRKTDEVEVKLRGLFIAAGTAPNTIYQSEHPGTFVMDRKFYKRHEPEWLQGQAELVAATDETQVKVGKPAPFTSYHSNGRHITFYGDNHPVYAGNVVKAMASAKDGYPYIVKLFANEISSLDAAQQAQRDTQLHNLQDRLDATFRAHVVAVNRLTPTIIEVVIKAPAAAKHFEPGQFYRVQNYESLAPVVEGTTLAAEGLALTGAWVDKEQGLVSLIALEMGSSSRLCATWKVGDPLVLMGVTGAPTEIPQNQTVLLLGGGLGNAVLFSIGKAMRSAGNKVLYFAGYRNREDLFKVPEIEEASDVIVWAVDDRPGNDAIPITRPQDKTFVGNIVEAMVSYATGKLGETSLRLQDVDHLIVIGSDRMMAAVKAARFAALKPYLKEGHEAVGSINSPMQCMMKGVCAQCLCKHVDPESGEESFMYSCYNQDQALDYVDFPNLAARLRQNTVQEKLSSLWLTYLLEAEQ